LSIPCRMLCDLMHLEGAESLANYSSDSMQAPPVVTRNKFGKGRVYYIGTDLEESALDKVLDQVTAEADVSSIINEPTKLEVTYREVRKREVVLYYKFCER
jgi:beta-galactosidase